MRTVPGGLRARAWPLVTAWLLCFAPAWAGPSEPPFISAFSEYELLGERLEAEWALPAEDTDAAGLVLLQHGFARRCANLRPMASALAGSGWATLCLNGDMARGHPALAAAWARRLLDTERPLALPDGRALPARWIAAGHSAGAAFALTLAAEIERLAPGADRLAGVLMLDPVFSGPRPEPILRPLRLPALAILAPPGPCNAQGQAGAALEAEKADGAAVRLLAFEDGTHLDAEGEATDRLAIWLCRQGPPRASAVQATRQAVVQAARAMARSSDAQPPGMGREGKSRQQSGGKP